MFPVCPDDMFKCPYGRVDGQQSSCITTEQRCDNVTDCIGGEDELDHNCPCGPEGAVRLVDGVVPHQGRVEYCVDRRWSTMCNIGYRQSNFAAVVCHQLGYPRIGMCFAITSTSVYSNMLFTCTCTRC